MEPRRCRVAYPHTPHNETTSEVVAVAILAGSITPGHAKVVKTIGGVTHYRDHVRLDQIPVGEPAVAFPLGCVGDACHYTVWLDWMPGVVDPDTCVDDGGTSWWDCAERPICVAWVDLGPNILPMRSWHGRLTDDGTQTVANVLLAHAFSFLWVPTLKSPAIQRRQPNLRGPHYEMLEVKGFDLEIAGANCSMGFYLAYHPDSTTVFRTGKLVSVSARPANRAALHRLSLPEPRAQLC